MRTSIPSILTTLLLVIVTGGCSSSGGGKCPFMHPDQAKIDAAKRVDNDFVAAFNTGNADATAAYYWNNPALVMYPPGEMECRGWQQACDALARVFQQMPGAKLELVNPQYRVAGKDVIGYGQWTLTPSQGQPIHGRYTEVIARKDDKWVMVLDHPSVPMAK